MSDHDTTLRRRRGRVGQVQQPHGAMGVAVAVAVMHTTSVGEAAAERRERRRRRWRRSREKRRQTNATRIDRLRHRAATYEAATAYASTVGTSRTSLVLREQVAPELADLALRRCGCWRILAAAWWVGAVMRRVGSHESSRGVAQRAATRVTGRAAHDVVESALERRKARLPLAALGRCACSLRMLFLMLLLILEMGVAEGVDRVSSSRVGSRKHGGEGAEALEGGGDVGMRSPNHEWMPPSETPAFACA